MAESDTNDTAEEPAGEEPVAAEVQTVAEAPAAPAAKRSTKPKSAAGLVAAAALIVALAASFAAALAWWQYRDVSAQISGTQEGLLGSFQATSSDLTQLAESIAAIELALAQRDAGAADISDDLNILATELRTLARTVETLQGGQVDARESWLFEQVSYYLTLANTELRLRRDVQRAIGALELADDGLLALADPALGDVRAAISAELQALRAVPQPDREGIVLELGSLIGRVDQLPMRAAIPTRLEREQASETADDEPGLGRLWGSVQGAMSGIVRVERLDEPSAAILTETEQALLRRQLALELQIARTAVFEQRQADFRASLMAADTILRNEFDREDRRIVTARELLSELMTVEIAPVLPEIGNSARLLRSAAGAR